MAGSTRRGQALTVVALVAVCGCTSPTPERQFIDSVARALGGADRIRAATTLTLEGTGKQWNLGQDRRPDLAEQTFTVTAFTRVVDLTAARQRTTLTRTPAFLYYQGPQAQTQITGLDGAIAYGGNALDTLRRSTPAVARDRQGERLHHPLVLIRAVLDGAAVSAVRTVGGERAVDVTTDAGPITLVADASGRPVRIESPAAHPNLGDVTLTTRFADYGDAGGGVVLPRAITTLVDDVTTGTYAVKSRLTADAAPSAPPAVTAAAAPAPPEPTVTVEQVVPGVWFLGGQSHHSAVVAFKDQLVLIEAPQSEARTLAVLEKARALVPQVPVKTLVLSHHHFDHSAGLRAAIANGLAVVTHDGNAAFVTRMAARPFTRQPDALAAAGTAPVAIQTVGDSHTISDGTRNLVLYHLAGNPHSDTLLMAWLPKERLLIEADAFSPEGGGYHPYAANLLQHIERLHLPVERIVPLHGRMVTMADLRAAVRQGA